MEIDKNLRDGTLDVMLKGKFTFSDHPAFRGILQDMARAEIRHAVLHMQGVEFVDSAALGMLLLARDEAEKHGKKLTIRGPAGQVKKMFDLAKFDSLFTILPAA